VENLEETVHLWNTGVGWMAYTKIDVKEICCEGVYWIHLAHDRFRTTFVLEGESVEHLSDYQLIGKVSTL
jgi:hypothetical protein